MNRPAAPMNRRQFLTATAAAGVGWNLAKVGGAEKTAVAADGARLRLTSTTSRLAVRVQTAPILCVPPIYSSNEPIDPAYLEKSVRRRQLMRETAVERRPAGDPLTFVVEGFELFGPADRTLLHDPQHPNDEGNELIAERLAPIVAKMVWAKK